MPGRANTWRVIGFACETPFTVYANVASLPREDVELDLDRPHALGAGAQRGAGGDAAPPADDQHRIGPPGVEEERERPAQDLRLGVALGRDRRGVDDRHHAADLAYADFSTRHRARLVGGRDKGLSRNGGIIIELSVKNLSRRIAANEFLTDLGFEVAKANCVFCSNPWAAASRRRSRAFFSILIALNIDSPAVRRQFCR